MFWRVIKLLERVLSFGFAFKGFFVQKHQSKTNFPPLLRKNSYVYSIQCPIDNEVFLTWLVGTGTVASLVDLWCCPFEAFTVVLSQVLGSFLVPSGSSECCFVYLSLQCSVLWTLALLMPWTPKYMFHFREPLSPSWDPPHPLSIMLWRPLKAVSQDSFKD